MRESWNPYKRNQFKYEQEGTKSPWDLGAKNSEGWLGDGNTPLTPNTLPNGVNEGDGGYGAYLEAERAAGRYSGDGIEGTTQPTPRYGTRGVYPTLQSWNRPENEESYGDNYEEYLANEKSAGRGDEKQPWWKKGDPVPMLAMNTDYSAYSLGQALGAPKGTRGKGMGIVAGLGDMTLGLGRNLLSGLADSKDTGRVYSDYRRRQDLYDRGPYARDRGQYVDASARYNKYGSLFQSQRKKYFAEGGEMSQEEAAMMEQMMQQGQAQQEERMPQEQQGQPQGGGGQEEMVEMATQLMEQFQGNLDAIAQYLEQEGVDEEMMGIIMQIVSEMAQGVEGQPQEEQLPDASGSNVMRNTMNGNMDMPMDFRNGGQYPTLPRY